MSHYYCQPSGGQTIKLTTERLKVLKVIGESIGQVVVENTASINAVKIDRIVASVRDVTDHIFTNKIVKQGVIHKQVFYVDPTGIVREVNENVPFMLAVDIAGVEQNNPFIEIENQVLNIETDFTLTPATSQAHGSLSQKVVAHILVKVSEWIQLDVVVRPNLCTKLNPLDTFIVRNQ
jgi:hypothetical protein